MKIINSINQGLVFLLEIAMFLTLVYWGYKQGNSVILKYVTAVGVTLIAILLWSIFAAPRSPHRLPTSYRILFSLMMFEGAALLLYDSGKKDLAVVFALLALCCEILAYFLE